MQGKRRSCMLPINIITAVTLNHGGCPIHIQSFTACNCLVSCKFTHLSKVVILYTFNEHLRHPSQIARNGLDRDDIGRMQTITCYKPVISATAFSSARRSLVQAKQYLSQPCFLHTKSFPVSARARSDACQQYKTPAN